jgi:methylated-DNA-[protein]-cysteine S-methyltransferase
MKTPIGTVAIAANDTHILGIRIGGSGQTVAATGHKLLGEAMVQFRSWFAGERQDFDLPLLPLESGEGERLRAGIAAIPYGETRTYGEVAAQAGSIARAVGQACKTNAYPLIIPCHRVVSTSGPEYYSAGDGPRTKSWLIDFEYGNLPPEKRTRLI